jgi:hypothetical protein
MIVFQSYWREFRQEAQDFFELLQTEILALQ